MYVGSSSKSQEYIKIAVTKIAEAVSVLAFPPGWLQQLAHSFVQPFQVWICISHLWKGTALITENQQPFLQHSQREIPKLHIYNLLALDDCESRDALPNLSNSLR